MAQLFGYFCKKIMGFIKKLLRRLVGRDRYSDWRDAVHRLLGKDVDWAYLPSAISVSRDIRVWSKNKVPVRTEHLLELITRAGLSQNMRMILSNKQLNYCGGLEVWQLPEQLAPAMEFLAKNDRSEIGSYLEIGVNRGGFFLFMTEWLRLRNTNFQTAIGVDMKVSPTVIHYSNENPCAHFLRIDSRNLLDNLHKKGIEQVDFIYIDGDHSYQGVKIDFEQALRLNPKFILLHDIQDPWCSGVQTLWQELKTNSFGYEVHEFTSCHGPTSPVMGLGLLVK